MKILAALFILGTIVSTDVISKEVSPLENITSSSKRKDLHNTRPWLKLLHVERNWLGIKGSQIASEQFFFSKTRANPEEELNQTLAGFLLSPSLFSKKVINSKNETIIDDSEHPICRFPARYHFLKSQLGDQVDYWNSLPKVNCVFQNIYLRAINPKSVSFVFSSYYSDSPGSAFGHTFFRINGKTNTEQQELLDYGAGFAAQVTVTNPVLYAMFGLFGGFNGTWTNVPYYYKVREYNDFEARDLWSYNLNLSEEEVKMFALHLWEVGSSSYNYYFFTQNCAFHMLTVLEAAAPRLHLIEHVPFYYVIPADSMKTLFYEKDLVSSVSYRPSLRRVFQERVKTLDPLSLNELHSFANNYQFNLNKENRSEEQYAIYLDSLLDLLNLRFPNLTAEKNEKIFTIKENILNRRSEVKFVTNPIVIEAKDTDRPDKSHGSSRVTLGYTRKNDDLNLGYRFAIHDLLDSTVGMPDNSQLEFFNFNFKKYDKSTVLDNFNIFKVLNLNPINFYEKKLSWGVKLGTRRLDIEPGKIKPFYSTGLESQFGYSFELTSGERPFILWTMGRADLGLATKNKNGQFGHGAIGYQLGLLKRINANNAFLLTYEKLHPYKLDSYENTEFEFRSTFAKNLAVGLGASQKYFKVDGYFYF